MGTTRTAIAIGDVLGSYRITDRLGEGGMGEVWRAEDTRLGRAVALKLLPSDFADDDDRHARFEREAKILASLNHSNIATLYGLEHLELHHVLVMELVEGEDLERRLKRGPLPAADVIAIGLFLWLGFWQLDRAAYKRELSAARQRQDEQTPLVIDRLSSSAAGTAH